MRLLAHHRTEYRSETEQELIYEMLDGREIPQLGLGVYEMSDSETYKAVKWAFEAGYKHVDTAEWYVLQFRLRGRDRHATGKG